MSKLGRFAAACAAVAVGLGVAGSLNAAETTVRRAVAATEGAPLTMPAGFATATVSPRWLPGEDAVGFANVFNNGASWGSGSVTVSGLTSSSSLGAYCPFSSSGKTAFYDSSLEPTFVGGNTYFCALYIKPEAGAKVTLNSTLFVTDCGSNVLTEEGWAFFTITPSGPSVKWWTTRTLDDTDRAKATVTYAYAINLTKMKADGILTDTTLGNCVDLFARRELKPGQNGVAVTQPKEDGKTVQTLTVESADGSVTYRHVAGTESEPLTLKAGDKLTVDNGSVVFLADMPVEDGQGVWAPYKWAVVGDSLSDPSLDPYRGNYYYDLIAAKTGIRLTVNGKGGTGYWATSESGTAFCQRLKTLPPDVDIVTIFGSVNDWKYYQKSVPIGTVEDRLPTDSVCAYVNAAIDEIQKRAPFARIVLCTGLYYYGVGSKYHGAANQAVVDVAATRGVVCYDWLNSQNAGDLDFHKIDYTQYGSEFGQKYTRDFKTDGSSFGHPSAAYNEEWLAPAFSQVLSTALGVPAPEWSAPVSGEGKGEDEGEDEGEEGGEGQGEEVTPEPQVEPEPVAEDAVYVDCNAAAGGDGTKEKPFQTIAEGVAAAGTDGKPTLVLVAEGTYTQAAMLTVNKAITVRGAGMDKTFVDGGKKVRGLSIGGNAVVENLTVQNCDSSSKVQGVGIAISSGVLRNCRVTNCKSSSAHDCTGVGVYLSGTALVTECIIENCTAGKRVTGFGAYLDSKNAVLEKTLVTRCTNGRDMGSTTNSGTVYVKTGTVRNCTIVGNALTTYGGLSLEDTADAKAYDTICWGNTTYNYSYATGPNLYAGAKAVVSHVCAPVAAAQDENPVTADPRFTDAANGDYTLRAGSPCIDPPVGAFPFDATKPSFGIVAGAYAGVESLETTLSLVSYGATVFSVSWTVDGVDAGSGESLDMTFGPGFHTIVATVTSSVGEVTVTEPELVKVYVSETYLDDDCATPTFPYATKETAAKTFDEAYRYLASNGTLHIAPCANPSKTPYALAAEYTITGAQKILGEDFTNTVLKAKNGSRLFNLLNKDALVAGVKMIGSSSGSYYGAGAYVAAGTVSNCWIYGFTVYNGMRGSIWIGGANARLTRSLVSGAGATGGSGTMGLGVYQTGGLVDNCLLIDNKATASQRSTFMGGGAYVGGGTLANCTVVGNACGQGPGVYATGSGTVVNTIIFGNTKQGTSDDNWGGTGSCFVNCCTLNTVGTGCVPVDTAPYEADYTLAQGSPCIDKGNDDYLKSTIDYFGEERPLGNCVDIGAAEYRPAAALSATVTCNPTAVVVGQEIVSTASAEEGGAPVTDGVCRWRIDGEELPFTGYVITNTLSAGLHHVELSVTRGGKTADAEPADVKVYSQVLCVETNAVPVFPYDTAATALTNIAEAVAQALPGMTLKVGEGRFRVTSSLAISQTGLSIVGAGMYKTTVFRSGGTGFRIVEMNATGSRISDLAITGGYGADGSGIYAHSSGGTIERCLVYNCTYANGGVCLEGSKAILRYSVVSNCATRLDSTQLQSGGGVVLDGGSCENCLIVGNKAYRGAGVSVGSKNGGTLRNCTIVRNASGENKSGSYGGAVSVEGGSVVNCLIVGNTCFDDSKNPDVYGDAARFYNCFTSAEMGNGCLTGTKDDVGFRDYDGGDYRFGAFSPCVRKGRYQGWMDEATDFFGRPRTTPGKHVDIGYFQSDDPGLMLLVR